MKSLTQLEKCFGFPADPFFTKSLFHEAEVSRPQPEASGEKSEPAGAKVETPELKALRDRIEAGEAKIAALESRSLGDMAAEEVSKDTEKVKSYVEGQYNNAVGRLTAMRDDLARSAMATVDSVVGEGKAMVDRGKAVLEAQYKELMDLKDAAQTELIAAETQFKAEVARIDKAVTEGWGDVLETGMATITQVENFATLKKEQVLGIAQSAWETGASLPEKAWKAIESGVGYTAGQALQILGKMAAAGRDVKAFAEKTCKDVSTFSEAQIKVLVETVKDNKKALAVLAGSLAVLPAAPALLVLGACLTANVGVAYAFGKLGEKAAKWAAPEFKQLVELCSQAPDYLVGLAQSAGEFTGEQMAMIVNAAVEKGNKTVEVVEAFGANLAGMTKEQLAEVAESIGTDAGALLALAVSIKDAGAEKVLAVLDTVKGLQLELTPFIEGLANKVNTWTQAEFQTFVKLCSSQANGLVELVKYNVNLRFDQAKDVVDTALKSGEDMVTLVEAFGTRMATWSAEELKSITEAVGEDVDSVVKVLETVKDVAWDKVEAVVDTAVGLGIEGSKLVEALGTRVSTLATEQMVVLMDKFQADKEAVLAIGEQLKGMAVDTAVAYLKKAKDFGVDTQNYVVDLANEGAAKAIELLAAAVRIGYDIPKAFFVTLAGNMASWTENEVTQFVVAVDQKVIQLNSESRVAYNAAKRQQRYYQRQGRSARTGITSDMKGGESDSMLASNP